MELSTISLIILCVAAIAFATEIIPLAATSMCVVVALVLTNCLTASEALAGFSNTTIFMFAGVFVIGGALNETSFASNIGKWIYKYKDNERGLIIAIISITTLISAFMATSGLCAILIPVIISISNSTGIKRSKLFLPMITGGTLGGGITLLGGPGNAAIYSALENLNVGLAFTFFDLVKIGLPLALVAIIYTSFIGYKVLPERETPDDGMNGTGFAESKLTKGRQNVIYAISVGTILAMIFADQIGIAMWISAVIGALLLVLTKNMNIKQVVNSINWPTLVMFAGILPLTTALTKTGASQIIGETIENMLGGHPNQYLVIFIIFGVSMILTQMMSNTATLALFCPLAGLIALQIGANPQPLIMAAGAAAGCSLCTPVGSPTNAMVYGPGGYKFWDYMKYGIPLCVLLWIAATLLVPMIWPVY